MTRQDVLVVGGGLIGLSIAWRAALAGRRVTVVDDRPGEGASGVAAGMLAPVTEAAYGEQALLALTVASARRWPTFAADLEAAADTSVDHRQEPTLLVGHDRDDVTSIEELAAFQRDLGLDVERLTARACRQVEPLLHPRVRGGVLARDDHRVDAQRVVSALLTACAAAGVDVDRRRAVHLEHDGRRVEGVTLDDGTRLASTTVVLAAGTWSADLAGIPDAARPPVRPVKGQLLVLRADDPLALRPTVTVRALVRGRPVYLVPREDGRLVVGATQEERGFDTTVTAGAVRQLLDDAVEVLPVVDELTVEDVRAGLRPGTPDNRPLVGPTGLDGLLVATGHHRHGALLAPLTADVVVAHLDGGDPGVDPAVLDPRRFAAEVIV
ncbi:glycine oxidase ThiO [Egicoccus sp. AB-alg2]|uniref:glycine oxidase ThiO n=1 Tax=Egicoccus sp. AB-alg2 TaxID=3242693 RepID=UPI00359CC613